MEHVLENKYPSAAEIKGSQQKSNVFKLLSSSGSHEERYCMSHSAKNNDVIKNTKFAEDREDDPKSSNQSKSSKVTSKLDVYCKTSALDESADFIDCDFKNKFKPEVKRNEILCEICKEEITHLDVRNRELHVNNCIDKQISQASETKATQASEPENVFILECPLCFKHFSSTEVRASHIKKCGKSKGLSVQSIIKALELHERHAMERISLGLPAKSIKPPAKSHKNPKNPSHKRAIVEPKSKAHSDIQLAKALSLSLASSQQEEEDVEATALAPVVLKPPSANQRPGKRAKTVLSSTPLLVLRSEEDRKRLLLERVATILTAMNSCEDEPPPSAEMCASPKQQEEQPDKIPELWGLSSRCSEVFSYYVEDLLNWIKPSDVEAGAKLCHLSQIPGHEIVTQVPCDYTFSAPDSRDKSSCDSQLPSSDSPVIGCLRSLVASSWMSDVDIHTSCGTVLPAHKLLLAARCPSLKQDPSFCLGSEKKVLRWETTSFDAALQFLNFVYTGNMDATDDMMPELSYLANKYEISDLQTFLRTTETSSISCGMRSPDRISLKGDTMTTTPKQPDEMENTLNSQEETNLDLDIVYNCIHSSLKPSQLSSSSNSFHSECVDLQESSEEHIQVSKTSSGIANMDSKSLGRTVSLGEIRPTSPMVYDINDNENDSKSPPSAMMFDVNDNENGSKTPNGSNCPTSPVLFDEIDPESPKRSSCSTPPLIIDVKDNEYYPESPKGPSCPTSPVIFDADYNECVFESPKESSHHKSSAISDVNDNKYDSESPQVPVCNSSLTEKCSTTVMSMGLGVNKSENDASESEKFELLGKLSQKSVQPNQCMEELDLCDTDSTQSQDSIRFLKSSFTSFNLSKSLKAEEIDILPTPSPTRKESMLNVDNLLPVPHELDEFHLNVDSKLVESSPSKRHHHFSYQSKPHILEDANKSYDERYNETVECKSKMEANLTLSPVRSAEYSPSKLILRCSPHLKLHSSENTNTSFDDHLNETVKYESKFEANRTLSLVKTEYAFSNSFKESGRCQTFAESSQSCKRNLLSPLKTCDRLECPSPAGKDLSPEVIICDSDSDLESSFHRTNTQLSKAQSSSDFYQKQINTPDESCGTTFKRSQTDSSYKKSGFLPEVTCHVSKMDVQSTEASSSTNFYQKRKTSPRKDHGTPVKKSQTDSSCKMSGLLPAATCHIPKMDVQSTEASSSSNFHQKRKKSPREGRGTPVKKRSQTDSHKMSDLSPKVTHRDLNEDELSLDQGLLQRVEKELGKALLEAPRLTEEIPLNAKNSYQSPASPIEYADDLASHEPLEEHLENDSALKGNSKRPPTNSTSVTTAVTKTPSSSGPKFVFSDSPITPLPDYKNMPTPDIRKALKRIGVRALPRKKAVTLLQHVYNELHPLVNGETNAVDEVLSQKNHKEKSSKPRKRKNLEENVEKPSKKQQKELSTSQESDDSGSENPQWAGCVPEMSFSQFQQDSPTKFNKDDFEAIRCYIQTNDDLYSCILSNKPLNLVEFHQELKSNGLKTSIQKLTDFLDEQCITFRCPRKEEYRKKQTARTQRFRKNMIAKQSQQLQHS